MKQLKIGPYATLETQMDQLQLSSVQAEEEEKHQVVMRIQEEGEDGIV
jgi:hypothetical protein